MRESRNATVIGWAVAVLAMVCLDQLLKFWVEATLPLQELVDVLPFFGLYRTYNTGVAFSMLSSFSTGFLTAFTLAVAFFVLWLWSKLEPGRWISAWGYALVLGGALGNLVDRVRLGKVVDYFLLHTQHWSFAVFNLADAMITIGAAAIILDEYLFWVRARNDDRIPDEGEDKNG